MRDSCGSSGTGETPQAFTPRRLIARPAESEHLEGKSTTPLYLVIATKYAKTAYYFDIKKRKEIRVRPDLLSLYLETYIKKIPANFSILTSFYCT